MKTISSIFLLLSHPINTMNMNENVQKPAIKNAAILTRSIEIHEPVEKVFNYIQYKLKDNYQAMADGHIKYELINGAFLKEGVEIDCRERASNQTVHHLYKVEKIIPNRHICYASKPSRVFIKTPWKTVESHSNTYCFYNFRMIDENTTELQLIIAIQFDNGTQKFFSTLVGGIAPWKKHQKEEMKKLKGLIEKK